MMHAYDMNAQHHPAIASISSQIVMVVAISLAASWSLNDRVRGQDKSTAVNLAEGSIAFAFTPIDTSGFGSSRHHWRELRGDNRIIEPTKDQPTHPDADVETIVANILLFQRDNGGWPKDYDMLAALTDNQRAAISKTRKENDTSYDNGNIHSQVEYLARAVSQKPVAEWRQACERGLDFILESQFANGGFPQRFPNPKSYHAHITFNDGVMIGILNVLSAAASAPHFAWLDEARRIKSRAAVSRGIDCILRCQIEVNGVRTGWCQQHDAKTFIAQPARSFELASICPQETTEIARFLMKQSEHAAETKAAIDAAAAWLDRSALSGIRIEKIKTKKQSFLRHDADFDVVVIDDPKATRIWARHYEIETNRPIFAGRDAIKKYSLADIEAERRTGTPWYGTWPSQFLEIAYPNWKKMQNQSR